VSVKQIVVIGSLNADLVVRLPRFARPGETLVGESFAQFPGGKGGNQACAAARLGGPARIAMLGRVGADAHGEWLRSHLAAAGVDVTGVRAVPEAPTGVALIAIDAAGENQIVVVAGANAAFTPAALREGDDAFRRAEIVLLQLEIPLETVCEAAQAGRRAGATIPRRPARSPTTCSRPATGSRRTSRSSRLSRAFPWSGTWIWTPPPRAHAGCARAAPGTSSSRWECGARCW
jgi:ribokinase